MHTFIHIHTYTSIVSRFESPVSPVSPLQKHGFDMLIFQALRTHSCQGGSAPIDKSAVQHGKIMHRHPCKHTKARYISETLPGTCWFKLLAFSAFSLFSLGWPAHSFEEALGYPGLREKLLKSSESRLSLRLPRLNHTQSANPQRQRTKTLVQHDVRLLSWPFAVSPRGQAARLGKFRVLRIKSVGIHRHFACNNSRISALPDECVGANDSPLSIRIHFGTIRIISDQEMMILSMKSIFQPSSR